MKHLSSPKVSVIVPAYNVEAYLSVCLESILKQSFTDFELLLIDDGSTDKSGEICDEYAMNDGRVRVFHKENGGVSSARNLGLDNAKGEWISFVDADDRVETDYLKNLISHVNNTIDLVVSYARIFDKNGNSRREVYPSKLITNENFEVMFIENDMNWHTAPWSKLYRHEIIKKYNLIFCETMHISEDALFNFQYMMYSRSIYISSDTDYCYFAEVESSLTKRVYSVYSELQTYHNIENIISFMIETKQIRNSKALHNLYYLNALNVRRVLNALYYNVVPRAERMKILMGMDIKMYLQYIGKQNSWRGNLYNLLLAFRLFAIYDLFRFNIAKRKIDKIKYA